MLSLRAQLAARLPDLGRPPVLNLPPRTGGRTVSLGATFLMGFGLGAVAGIYCWAIITGPPTRFGSWLAGKIRRAK